MEDLYERPRKLIHRELRGQCLDFLTYKDIGNISRNMHKARSSQLLHQPKDTEESHEALIAIQVLTVRQNLLVNDSEKKTIVILSCKRNLQFFLAPLMGFTLTGHSNQHRSFSTNSLQFMGSLCAICIGCKPWCECFSKIVYAEFETAIHKAVTTVWPVCEVKTRPFHLGKSWWLKMQSLGRSKQC